jgi:hypothetical protein
MNDHSTPKDVLSNWLAATLCTLACFPYDRFKRIDNWPDKANVLVRGAAVPIGSTVCALTLYQYAGAVFDDTAFVMMLPLVMFLIDRLNCGSAWGGDGISRAMYVLRVVLVLITVIISVHGFLLGEQTGLHTDLGVLLQIVAHTVVLMILQTLPLVLAWIPVPQGLRENRTRATAEKSEKKVFQLLA